MNKVNDVKISSEINTFNSQIKNKSRKDTIEFLNYIEPKVIALENKNTELEDRIKKLEEENKKLRIPTAVEFETTAAEYMASIGMPGVRNTSDVSKDDPDRKYTNAWGFTKDRQEKGTDAIKIGVIMLMELATFMGGQVAKAAAVIKAYNTFFGFTDVDLLKYPMWIVQSKARTNGLKTNTLYKQYSGVKNGYSIQSTLEVVNNYLNKVKDIDPDLYEYIKSHMTVYFYTNNRKFFSRGKPTLAEKKLKKGGVQRIMTYNGRNDTNVYVLKPEYHKEYQYDVKGRYEFIANKYKSLKGDVRERMGKIFKEEYIKPLCYDRNNKNDRCGYIRQLLEEGNEIFTPETYKEYSRTKKTVYDFIMEKLKQEKDTNEKTEWFTTINFDIVVNEVEVK